MLNRIQDSLVLSLHCCSCLVPQSSCKERNPIGELTKGFKRLGGIPAVRIAANDEISPGPSMYLIPLIRTRRAVRLSHILLVQPFHTAAITFG